MSALVGASVAQAQASRDARAAGRSVFDLVLANGRVLDPETGLVTRAAGTNPSPLKREV